MSLKIVQLFVFFNLIIINTASQANITRKYVIGNYTQPVIGEVDPQTEYIIEFNSNIGPCPVRIIVSSNQATKEKPLLVVVQQQQMITSWQLPYIANPLKNPVEYHVTGHTLCPSSITYAKKMPINLNSRSVVTKTIAANPIVTIKSPASNSKLGFTLTGEIHEDFFLKTNKEYNTTVSASQPIYYYYSFLNEESENHSKESGAVLVELFSMTSTCMLISIQNSTCPVFDLETNVKFDSYWQTMTRKAATIVKRKEYPMGFYIVMVIKEDDAECGKKMENLSANKLKPISLTVKNTITVQDHIIITISTLSIFAVIFLICTIVGCIFLVRGIRKSEDFSPGDTADGIELTNGHRSERWHQLFRASSRSKKSTNYVWHVGIVALFYTFPVLQLVFTYQGIVHETGNEDICYYNFLCAHPLGFIYDFNHVFSNIGYVFLGVLFLLITYVKELLERSTLDHDFGLPKPYGMFYALGFALVMEGIMSACYHVCPKSSNFQFDTAFMYVMTVLMIVNIYENRHSNGDSRGYAVFGILAGATTLSVISLVVGETYYFWGVFAVIQIGLCLYLTWTLEKNLISMLFNKDKRKQITKIHICRIVLWLFGNIINWLLVAYGIYILSGFGTYLLMVLIVNGLFYTIYYISMKLCYKEKILVVTWIFIVLATVIWVIAMYFFVSTVTSWEKSPAESRNLNEECALVEYYDSHDIWHFLSSVALFLTFIVLLTLDEGLVNVKRADIPDFHGN